MEPCDIPKPNPDEKINPVKNNIEEIGERVLKSLKESPPTKKLSGYRETDPFWSTPAILVQTDVTYGETHVYPDATNEGGSTSNCRRKILNLSGVEIGEWEKIGHYRPNSDRTIWLREKTQRTDEKQTEAITVYLDETTQAINSIERTVSNFNPEQRDFTQIQSEELKYTYDDEGKILTIELKTKDPKTGNILSKREIFRDAAAYQQHFLKKIAQPIKHPENVQPIQETPNERRPSWLGRVFGKK